MNRNTVCIQKRAIELPDLGVKRPRRWGLDGEPRWDEVGRGRWNGRTTFMPGVEKPFGVNYFTAAMTPTAGREAGLRAPRCEATWSDSAQSNSTEALCIAARLDTRLRQPSLRRPSSCGSMTRISVRARRSAYGALWMRLARTADFDLERCAEHVTLERPFCPFESAVND
jgi:hypothetical protein